MTNDNPTGASVYVDQLPNPPGATVIDPRDPAAPFYELLAKLRTPLTLRDMMMKPVRDCYIGQGVTIDPAELPKSAAEIYPQIAATTLSVPSSAGPIRCQLFSPPVGRGARAMMLYIHGGGFTVGRSEDTAYITSRMAAENDLVVVSVNYRLAPEWPFPFGLDDCMAVLNWMRKNGSSIGGDGSRIVISGDSAGGNLAAVLPIKAKQDGAPAPSATVLFCPITDFHYERYESFEQLAPRGVVYDTAFMGFIRGAYLNRRADWENPLASPLLANLAHYPPTLVITGTADPLVDDNRAFARKLKDAGVAADHFIAEAMPHGFYFFPGVLAPGEEAYAAINTFLERVLSA